MARSVSPSSRAPVGLSGLLMQMTFVSGVHRASLDVAVGEAARREGVQKRLLVAAGQLEELVEGQRVHARLGDVVGALRLPEVHPLLDFEILDLHGGSPSR